MVRKVFISFLGAGNYKSCVYSYDSKKSKIVTYVQSAVTDIIANDFDEYIIFCTKVAFDKHFELLKVESTKRLRAISIPDGINETEIWNIFQIVFNKLQEGDEIIYDVTHSFRSLPMLGIVLLQYAKFLKKIKVKGIYYGAFEQLGNPSEIEQNYPNPQDRNVPLLNLTSFSVLQDWTIAANNFIELGNSELIRKLTVDNVNPILSKTKGTNLPAKKLRNIANKLDSFSKDIRTNRGTAIYEGKNIKDAQRMISEIEDFDLIPAFEPIVKNINKSIVGYKLNNISNLWLSIQWCIDKGLAQEGFTQLQEGIITAIALMKNWDYKIESNRNLISSYLNVRFNKNIEQKDWKNELAIEMVKVEQLDEIPVMEEMSKIFTKITNRRNDINHGGFTDAKLSDSFFHDLKNYFTRFKELLEKFKNNAH